MSTGITFDNLADALDYQKMKMYQGEKVSVKPEGRRYRATIVGKIEKLSFPYAWHEQDGLIGKPLGTGLSGSATYSSLEKDKLPPFSMRRAMDWQGITYDVDPELRQVLIELNKRGYKTAGSCSGHKTDTGYITIKQNVTDKQKEEIIKIMKRHGINATVTGYKPEEQIYFSAIDFDLRKEPKEKG